MGDHKESLGKARRELEELYLGIPDDSVNLTFQHLSQISNHPPPNSISASKKGQHLAKIPSLDFSRGLESFANMTPARPMPSQSSGQYCPEDHHGHAYNYGHHGHGTESSMAYDDMSGMSMASMYQDKGGRHRRPGLPHSNICTICTLYIYIFRNRCLVCGRVYCRQCVNIGMGDMTEGRKCIECLGRKFSLRYIHRAGNVGCWSSLFKGYPSGVKMQELKWAEKGPRRSGDNRSMMRPRSRSPPGPPRTPNRAHTVPSGPPSFVTNSDYSPYATPTHHHLPF